MKVSQILLLGVFFCFFIPQSQGSTTWTLSIFFFALWKANERFDLIFRYLQIYTAIYLYLYCITYT